MSQAKICEMFQNKHFLCCHLSLVVKPVICVGAGRLTPRAGLDTVPVSHSSCHTLRTVRDTPGLSVTTQQGSVKDGAMSTAALVIT